MIQAPDNSPPLSVVMSVYNGELYVAEAIESILNQSFKDFEFVIINDGSKDSSTAILQSYAHKDPRIKLIEQDNTGLTEALRRGVAAAEGEFIARMDADDLSCSHRFERQIHYLQQHPGAVAVTSHFENFSDDGTVTHISRGFGPMELLPLYNCFGNRIGGHGQVMFRRSAYDLAGGYDPSFRYAQDYDLWARLANHGDFGMVEDTLYRYRKGHDCISTKSKSGQNECALRTCRREFHKLTGEEIDEVTAQALQDLWAARDLSETPMQDIIKASKAMAFAAACFFQRNPALRHHRQTVNHYIADRWGLYRARTEPALPARKAVYLANQLYWKMCA